MGAHPVGEHAEFAELPKGLFYVCDAAIRTCIDFKIGKTLTDKSVVAHKVKIQ